MAEKISFEKIEEIMNERFFVVDTMDWYGVEVEVKSLIPFALASELVRRIADACFSDDGEYMPEVSDFALRLGVIEAYTNIELPDNVEEQNRLLYGTDLWEDIISLIYDAQFNMIVQSVNQRVSYRLDTNKAAFERGVNEVMDGLMQLGEQFNTVMADVEPGDVKRMIEAIGENGIDEEKIVKAVVSEQNKARDNVVVFPAAEEAQT